MKIIYEMCKPPDFMKNDHKWLKEFECDKIYNVKL